MDPFIIVYFVAFAAYFLPSIIAARREHLSGGSIFVINLLLGWTVLGWIICLAWSCGGNVEPKPAAN